MGVIRYDITEQSFVENDLASYELSILTGVDSSGYLLVDANQRAMAIRAISHPPRERWWEQDARLDQSFNKVRIGWLSDRFTLIPARLYQGEDRRVLLSELTELREDETVLADALPNLDSFLVYAIEQDRLNRWRRDFVGSRFFHGLTPILHELSQIARQLGRPQVFAYLRDQLLITVGLERDRLVFCNAFKCLAAKDYLYYVLLTYEQCGWKPTGVPLRLLGEVLPEAEVYKLFYRYVKEVDLLVAPAGVHLGNQARSQSGHLFFDLVALQQYHSAL